MHTGRIIDNSQSNDVDTSPIEADRKMLLELNLHNYHTDNQYHSRQRMLPNLATVDLNIFLQAMD
jgi:hypothetical protein